jgi:excisionase family DNA binding protein
MQYRTKSRRSEAASSFARFAIQPRLLRIPEAAAYLGATNWFVEELVRASAIPFLTVGKYRVIDTCDLDTWIEKEKGVQWPQQRQQSVA